MGDIYNDVTNNDLQASDHIAELRLRIGDLQRALSDSQWPMPGRIELVLGHHAAAKLSGITTKGLDFDIQVSVVDCVRFPYYLYAQ